MSSENSATPNQNLTGKPVEMDIKPYGRMSTVTDDSALVTYWDGVFALADLVNGGEWVYEKGSLIPKKHGRKDVNGFSKAIDEAYPELAERAIVQTEFRRIQDARWVRVVESTETKRREPLDSNMVRALHQYVRWVPRSGGSASLVVRASANTWTPCVDPWTELTYYYPQGKTSADGGVKPQDALFYLSQEVESLQEEGKTEWGVSSSVNPMSGKATRTYSPFLTAARTKTEDKPRLVDTILSDIRFAMEEPVTFSNDPDTPCLSFFPLSELDKHRGGDCRHWLNFESQIPDGYRETWRAQFFGVFNDKNRSRQITLLVDQGQTGKSSVFRAIMKVAGGKFVSSQSKDSAGNQFWASSVYGSRLVLFPDTGNTKVSMMTKIKQLTGGDPIPVEFKNQTPFTWTPNVRIWTSTNILPEIDTLLKHQRSRMLVFPLTAVSDPEILKEFCDHHVEHDGTVVIHRDSYGDPINLGWNYDDVLAEEFWSYLALCEASYKNLCKNNQDIPVPPAMEAFIAGGCRPDSTTALNALLTHLIEFIPGMRISNKDLKILCAYVGQEGKDVTLKYSQAKAYLKSAGCQDYHNGANRGLEGIGLRKGVVIVGDAVRIAGSTPQAPATPPKSDLSSLGGDL